MKNKIINPLLQPEYKGAVSESQKEILAGWDFSDKPYTINQMRPFLTFRGPKARLFRFENNRAGTNEEIDAYKPAIQLVHDYLMAKGSVGSEPEDPTFARMEKLREITRNPVGPKKLIDETEFQSRYEEYLQFYEVKAPNHKDSVKSLIRQKFRLEMVQKELQDPSIRKSDRYRLLMTEEEKLAKEIRGTEDALGISLEKQAKAQEGVSLADLIDTYVDQANDFWDDSTMTVQIEHCAGHPLGHLYLVNLKEHGAALEYFCPSMSCPDRGKRLTLIVKPDPRPGETNLLP